MKLITLFLFLGSLSVAAESYSQKTLISINLKNSTIKGVMESIEKQTEYVFIFSDEISSDLNKKVDVRADSKTLNQVLDDAFKSTDLNYKINDRQVTVSKTTSAIQQKITDEFVVKGTVTDKKTGEPLVGVNIHSMSDSKKGAISDLNGEFSITLSSPNEKIIFKYIGYVSKEIIPGKLNQLKIELEENQELLDEVVVVGYGSQKRASVVGAVQTVKASDLVAPTAQLSSSFAGKIAGVIAVQRSGEPGADGANFWIRGISTLGPNAVTTPLVILDGVEVSMNDINSLAPEVIAGFSVLKDASATALYGARGANGVLVVTTRNGEAMDKPRVNIRVETSVSSPTQLPKLANGVTFMNMYNEAIRTRIADPTKYVPRYSDEKIAETANHSDQYVFPDVDWYSEIFKKAAWNQNLNMNVMGGGKTVNYFINASIRHDQGLFQSYDQNSINTNLSNLRYAFQNNLNAHITPTTRIGLKVSAILEDYNRPNISTGSLFTSTMNANPVEFPKMFPTQQGISNIMFGNRTGGPSANRYPNPFADLMTGQNSTFESTVLAIFDFDQDLKMITKGLRAKGTISFKNWSASSVSKTYSPYYYEVANYQKEGDGTYSYNLNRVGTTGADQLTYGTASSGDKLTTLQGMLEYDRAFGKHNVAAALIYQQRSYKGVDQYLPQRNQGLAGRATYNFMSKYFAEFNFGYNGSENFMKGHRFGFFPSYALGYLISNEDFFEPLKDVFNSFKIRGSFGYVGNSFTNPAFPYLTEISMTGKSYKFGNEWQNYKSGYSVTKYGNPDATWERSEKLDLGVEFSMLTQNLNVIADYFSENRTGIFLQRASLPSSVGVGVISPYRNMGETSNKGVDFTIDYSQKINSDWNLGFKTSFTYNHSKIIAQDEPLETPPNRSVIGKPIGGISILMADRLLTKNDLNDQIERDGYSKVAEGDIKYLDINNDGVISDNDIMALNKTQIPQIVYGFGVSAKYKRFDASVFFQGSAKVWLLMSDMHPFGQMRRNVVQYIADSYWSEANPNINAEYPRLSDGDFDNNTQPSSFWLRDASFLRLKQAELGYSFKKLRVYASGLNLLTFSKFKLWDPEMGSGNGLGYPPQQIINLGLQYNF